MTVKYGILLNDKLVTCVQHRNRQPFSVEHTVRLVPWGDDPWLVDDINVVKAVLSPDYQSPGWYNADWEHPIIDEIDLSKAVLVKVETQVKLIKEK